MVTYVSYGPCFLCGRDCDQSSVRVDFGQNVETVCAICLEKADEGIELPLDMTEECE